MGGVRGAFLWASAGRYSVMTINLAATLIMARLLAPAEYGVSVLAGAVFALAEGVRALGGGAYLIQKQDLKPENIRTSFTINLIVTIIVTTALILSVRPLTHLFGASDLEPYLRVAAIGYLTGPFIYPISALMSRNMAFRTIGLIGTATALLGAGTGICLALSGFSYMSFAWAGAAASVASMLLYLYCWRDWTIFRPALRAWRSVISFGAYDSATAILSQAGEALPYFILGWNLDPGAIALCQRALLLCLFPERVILAGVSTVALPAFAQQARDGQTLKQGYLRAIELITAAQWPCLLMLAVLAEPIVAIVLGPQWREVAPLMQILAVSLLFSFPVTLHYPTLVALGAIRYLPPLILVQAIVTIVALVLAARNGVQAVALSTLVIVPIGGLLSLLMVRYFLQFRWLELAAATWRSMIVGAASIAGPTALVLFEGGQAARPIIAVLAAGALSAFGWMIALVATHHPLLQEMVRAAAALRRRIAAKLGPAASAPGPASGSR